MDAASYKQAILDAAEIAETFNTFPHALSTVGIKIGEAIRLKAEKTGIHWSDCATHNMPAMPNGECDCGANAPTGKE